jgi:probable phosphoglycerate mutase
MVGADQDLPLTALGRDQARAVGAALLELGLKISRVIAGPLLRTREFASLLIDEGGSNLKLASDNRLRELDYGAWGGLSDDEIRALSGDQALRDWQERGVRPEGVEFSPSAEDLDKEARALLGELSCVAGVSVLVTSNGRLREFGRVVADMAAGAAKVGTGCVCVLEFEHGKWRVVVWNERPDRLRAGLIAADMRGVSE